MLHSFFARGRRSSLVWPRKSASFSYVDFSNFIIFDPDGQYVYQMKAENIPNLNLTWKIQFFMNFFSKNGFFMIFALVLMNFFFRNSNFSKNFIYNTQNWYPPLVLNILKCNYMKFDTLNLVILKTASHWTPSGLIPPPPHFLKG